MVARSAGGGGIAVPIVGVIIAVDTGQPRRANSSTNPGANGASGPVTRILDGLGVLCMDLLLYVTEETSLPPPPNYADINDAA